MDEAQAKFLTDQLATLWEREFPATCAVLAAVPDGGRDYRPDEKSRTAWEIATHLAVSDIWFLDSVVEGRFVWDAAKNKATEDAFQSCADVAGFYARELPAKLAQVRALPGERLAAINSFFGMFEWPNAQFVGFANNHSVHHRGQLAAYLRAMGSKVPAIYGASADVPRGS